MFVWSHDREILLVWRESYDFRVSHYYSWIEKILAMTITSNHTTREATRLGVPISNSGLTKKNLEVEGFLDVQTF